MQIIGTQPQFGVLPDLYVLYFSYFDLNSWASFKNLFPFLFHIHWPFCLGFLRHPMTKHQYYLQLRKDILEERMRCNMENAMILASLALQAEIGDYQPEVQTHYNWLTIWCTVAHISHAIIDSSHDLIWVTILGSWFHFPTIYLKK